VQVIKNTFNFVLLFIIFIFINYYSKMMKFSLINSKTKYLFVSLILFLAFLTQSWFSSQSNEFLRVVGVKDGDTVVLLTAAKEEITVRLSEIDAPERKQAFGTVSRTFLSDLIFGKEVKLEKLGTDRYGRTLGFIYLRNGTNVNLEMVKNGMAWQYEKYSKSAVLKKAQASAKSMKVGLWRDPYPVAPWEFRRK
jgi:endonuclease YncB( thermonuclease family)